LKRYVLDTNLFIDAARDRGKAEELSAFTSAFLPQVHLHSIVVQELLAGATNSEWRRDIERGLVGPFERRGRILTPSYRAWKRSGEVVAELVEAKRLSVTGIRRSFLNDVLLAASCREEGFTLVTGNVKDFAMIAEVEPVRFVPPWPKS
jgi:predicted nucleic acid-binding protein